MRIRFVQVCIGLFLVVLTAQPATAQTFIRKVKNKAEDKAIDKIFQDKSNQDTQTGTGTDPNSPSNTRGGGLNATAPDVLASIESAGSSFSGQDYADARYSVRQAILGIELEIGKNILKELPEKISGLPAVESEDQVTSSGIGFVGLIIQRTYREGEKEFRISIGNDAAMLSAANLYLASGAYSTSTQEENMKQIKFKDHNAVIQYDESSGYMLNVSFGQSSVLITNGINFNSEDDFMNASGEVDIENIKKQLGEQ